MKRTILIALAPLVALSVIGVGLALVRPAWMPHWARVGAWNRGGDANPGEANDAGLYCKEHGVPEKFCTLCHEELIKTLPLCKQHGNIPEEICTKCHPDVEKAYKIEMCPKGHGLPASFCVECGNTSTTSASLPDDGWCATHGKPEVLCPDCAKSPRKIGPLAPGELSEPCRQPLPVVKLATAKMVRQVGIQTALVAEEVHSHRLGSNAETAYDANHYAEISPRVTGFLSEIRVDLGQTVRRGEVLAVVDSAEVSAAKGQLLSAHSAVRLAQATAERTKSLSQSGAVPARAELEVMTALNQAQTSAMDAEQKLRNLGFDNDQLAEIIKNKDTRNLLDVVSPIDGVVVLRHAVKGEAVQATSQLFAVADTSRMWLWIDVYERDISLIAPGQPVSFTISGADPNGQGHAFLGEVTWVGTEVSDKTRTSRIRAELANPNGRLRANQFGEADIQIGAEHKAIVVPKAAVQRKDGTDLVFLPLEESGQYRAQRVVTKPTDHNDVVEVAWGLKPGQRVVTKGAFLLKTEIMRGAIGAGCCE
ncbi:efflux RND transporter periplasmic adaptor subunit [Singulisphaera acidiphila]|uniref:RND family efflux transporter, MFP subunit n=1 Tax=Singulisphaera acidiphila (strain ATCC BAA-1392 / DSM 18658 / VKM B-2454 / MOB10) TaxID=886293 RepID=L0DC48_SINAD|nr:efflux RND transporter periplasmic adaptor subunit [Singulisphaera acidiphila]AGA26430.1 RND family efflux transporter, MFP subunit [Singulisphaera acidiphila DSM 18658]